MICLVALTFTSCNSASIEEELDISAGLISRASLEEVSKPAKTACCFCQKENPDIKGDFVNDLTPAVGNCADKQNWTGYKDCHRIEVTDGPCSLMTIRKFGSTLKCTAVNRHYLENDTLVEIAAPKPGGICDPEISSMVGSLPDTAVKLAQGRKGPESPCSQDTETFCSDVDAELGVPGILKCLKAHKEQLSPECARMKFAQSAE